MDKEIIRCAWAGELEIYKEYHDKEWGKPEHGDLKLFEMLILEGMQAGLSWIIVLNKRENMRLAFDNFAPSIIARYNNEKLELLMQNPGIIRNRLKLNALVQNAKTYFEVVNLYGSFDKFIWQYVNHKPIINSWTNMAQVPATSAISDKMSKDMKKLGFKFVGSTIMYAFMQAVGMVNDHMCDCDFR